MMTMGKEGNVKWVDGLRGLASVLVVMTHVTRAFNEDLFYPAHDDKTAPIFLQLPFARVLTQGRIGVSIFAFVTGYVCALKPLKLYRQGNQEMAFMSIARSSLRRVPRLILPASLATLISFIMGELGLFRVAKHMDHWWAGKTAPTEQPDLVSSFRWLVQNLMTTWTIGENNYDGNQWTMFPLLKGSMIVYVFLLATSYMQPRYRLMASLTMCLYYYVGLDPAFGMMFFWGVFLCEVQNIPSSADFITHRPRLTKTLTVICLLLGLYIASYPEGHQEWQKWSSLQHDVLVKMLPLKAEFPRYASAFGLELLTLGIHFSPLIKDFLSSKYLLWLGKQSFAVYLLHGPLLRWLLCWMVYGVSIPPDTMNERGEMVPSKLEFPGVYKLLIWLPVWIPLNYGVAVLWTTYVDPWCASTTEKLVNWVKLDDTEQEGVLLPQ